MARRPRFYPPRHLVEVVTRVRDGRFLLAPQEVSEPTDDLHQQLAGLLERYRRDHEGKIFAVHVASNHYHFLLSFPSATHLAHFMRDFNAQSARLVKRLREGVGEGGIWSRRYAHTVVLDEASALERVRYIFAQAVSANLCERPGEWPGLQTVDALCRGEALVGTWFSYDRRRRAAQAGKPLPKPKRYEVRLSPLPQWADLPLAQRQARYQQLEQEVVQAAAEKRAGIATMGVGALLKVSIHKVPDPSRLERSCIPQWHCAERVEEPGPLRKQYREAYWDFVDQHRQLVGRLVRVARSELSDSGTLAWMSLP